MRLSTKAREVSLIAFPVGLTMRSHYVNPTFVPAPAVTLGLHTISLSWVLGIQGLPQVGVLSHTKPFEPLILYFLNDEPGSVPLLVHLLKINPVQFCCLIRIGPHKFNYLVRL